MNAAVHRLHFATVRAEDQQIDVCGYLVLAGGHAVLVDTGMGDGSALVEKRFRPRRLPRAYLGRGVDAGSVKPASASS